MKENQTFRTKSVTASGKEIIVSANQFCATCFCELTISKNAVVASFSYNNGKSIEQSTMFTFANDCVGCCKNKLSSLTKSERKVFLVQACNEIAMAFYFELGQKFGTPREVLESDWFDCYFDNFRRELRLTDAYLPLEFSGKSGRKAYRRKTYKGVYTAIATQFAAKSSGYYRANR